MENSLLKFHPHPLLDTPPYLWSNRADQNKKSLIQQYPDVFKGIEKLKHHEAKFYTDNSVPPVATPSRPIPFHLWDQFESEICKMEEADIIEPNIGPAWWISNPVFAPKDILGTRVQNHMVAPRLTQPFILLRSINWVPGISRNLVVKSKMSPRSGSVALRQLNPIQKKGP